VNTRTAHPRLARALSLGALLGLAALTGACTTTGRTGPVDVTRYHLGQPVSRGSFTVEPLATNTQISPEYRNYADAVASELTTLGFQPAAPGATGDFIAVVAFTRASRQALDARPPVSVGVGAGSYGGGVGLSVRLGGRKRDTILSELHVQLRERRTATVVWEGRAQTASPERSDAAQPVAAAGKLAAALFRGFPGESGITITVR
jgi:hypothetical protein